MIERITVHVVRIKQSFLDNLYFVVFVVFIGLFITGQFSGLTGVTLVVIDNRDPNSMFPTYFQGDLFVIYEEDAQDIQIGDVIVYNDGPSRIIHRVIDIEIINGDYYFMVKGDDPITNDYPDGLIEGNALIPYNNIVGKVVYRMPYLGHISLAMQRNFMIQMLVYISAIIVGLAIAFWPSKEEEEEEKYYEISTGSFVAVLVGFKSSVINTLKTSVRKKYRIITLLLIFAFIAMLITPLVYPLLIMNADSEGYGIANIEVSKYQRYDEAVTNSTFFFMQVSVTLFDYSSGLNKIEGFTVLTYLENGTTPISETTWHSIREMKGEFMIGGSAIFDFGLIDNTAQDLRIVVTVTMTSLFSQFDWDPQEISFAVNYV